MIPRCILCESPSLLDRDDLCTDCAEMARDFDLAEAEAEDARLSFLDPEHGANTGL